MNFQFPQIITNRRKELQLTQEQVAQFIGVSRAAVSKWEQGQSYPDIVLLPKLAMYFDMTIDELLGYEPQLTNAAIERIYAELAKDFTEKTLDEVFAKIDQLVAEYYSCYPFLVKLAQLYVNHFQLSPEATERAIVLCQRVKEHAEDIQLINEATVLEAMCYLMQKKPEQVLALLGDNIPLQYGQEHLIVTAHNMLGHTKQAKMLMQVAYYQQFIHLMQSAIESLVLEADNPAYTEETVVRLEGLFDLYKVGDLHENTLLVFYLKSAMVYMMQGNAEAAKNMLAKYMHYAMQIEFPLRLSGDSYFYLLDAWLDSQGNIMKSLPRDERAVKREIVSSLHNPIFVPLFEDPQLQALFETMKHHYEKGGI